MGKKVKEYKAGDYIFAKVKGYPAWPARVQKPNGKKYFVYFYGTGETANLPPNQIFDYVENKDKFLTKTIKRKDFNDGARQIEHDFANNVPLEQVIGVPVDVAEEPMDTSANDTVNDTTADDSALDTTAADTPAETTTADDTIATQNDAAIEDSDEGALIIDEGKKGKKPAAKPPATPKPGREAKTPRGKPKKDDAGAKERDDAPEGEEKREEEIVSRSGRKIRPKRYIDEQTEDNATLPSPAAKKRRGTSPAAEKEKPEKNKKSDPTLAEKTSNHYNAVSQVELEDLKEPFQTDDEKEPILVAYLPSGQYVGIKLFQHRPMSFKNDASRLQWDRQAAAGRITLKHQLEKGHITAQSVITQLEMDLNLTDEEKTNLDKEREIEEKKSRVQFLKTEMKLIELDAKIKSCLSLEKADTDLCLKLLDELMELDVKCLMLLKHPLCLETVKRMRAYVGNTPSWEMSEADALQFAKQASLIRRGADAAYRRLKDLFSPPEGLSFWEYFSERVVVFKKCTAHLTGDERLEMIHQPLEMTMPTSHTMKASIEAANEVAPPELDDSPPKKLKATPAKSKKAVATSTPAKTPVKRQSSRSKLAEASKEESKPPAEEPAVIAEETEKPSEQNAKDPEPEKEETDEIPPPAAEEPVKEAPEPVKDAQEPPKETPEPSKETEKPEETKQVDGGVKEAVKPTQNDEKQQNSTEKNGDEPQNDKADESTDKPEEDEGDRRKEEEDKVVKTVEKDDEKEKKTEKAETEKKSEKAEKEKEDVVEPRAKRARESNRKTEPPPPKSPGKRKSRS